MLTKNMDDTLVNGSMGKVLGFVDGSDGNYERVAEEKTGTGADKKPKSAAVGVGQLYPLVEFSSPGGHKKKLMITPETWKVELPSGEVQVSRNQVGPFESSSR
jgi:ATP-dependent DNA helicase PIF1